MTPAEFRQKPQARKCEYCGKPDIAKAGGCMSYRYEINREWRRGYFHPKCFQRLKDEINFVQAGKRWCS